MNLNVNIVNVLKTNDDYLKPSNQSYDSSKTNSVNDTSKKTSSFASVLSKSKDNGQDSKNVTQNDTDNKGSNIEDTLSKIKEIKEQLESKGETLQEQVEKILPKDSTEDVNKIVDYLTELLQKLSGDTNLSTNLANSTGKNITDEKNDFQGNTNDDKAKLEDNIDKMIAVLSLFLLGGNNANTANNGNTAVGNSTDTKGISSELLANSLLQDSNLTKLGGTSSTNNVKSELLDLLNSSTSNKTEVSNAASELLKKLTVLENNDGLDLGKLKQNLQAMISDNVTNEPATDSVLAGNVNTNQDSKTKDIKETILQLIALKNNIKDSSIDTNKLKVTTKTANEIFSTINKLKSEDTSDGTADSTKKLVTASDDDKVLKSIIGDKDTNVQSKFSMMIDQLKNNTTNVSNPSDQPVINKSTMVNDIVKSVQYMEKQDIKELTLKTNPGTLGEVTIKLTMESNVMKATITANTKEAYSLLNDHIKDLQSSLSTSNIKIPEVSIELRNDNYNNPNRGQNGEMTNFGFGSEQRENRQGSNNGTNSNGNIDDNMVSDENIRQAEINNNLNYYV